MTIHPPRSPAGRALLGAALLAALACGGVAAEPESPPSGGAEGFFDPPKRLRFDVESERGAGNERLIAMRGEFESVFRCPMEDVVRTLWDFDDAPNVFKRIESVRVRSDDGRRAVTEQTTAIRILGASFVSSLVFEDELERPDGSTAVFSFRAIELDAATRSSSGSWLLEELGGDSGARTRVRYSMDLVVAASIPGMELAMRAFGEADIRNAVRELAEAAARRNGSGRRPAAASPPGPAGG